MSALTRAFRFARQKPQSTLVWQRLSKATVRSVSSRLQPSRDGVQHIGRNLLTPGKSLVELQIPHPYDCFCCRGFSSKDGSTKEGSESPGASAITSSDNTTNETQEFQIPGAQAGGKKLAVVYTCKVCNTRSIKQFSEHSYQNGVVLVRCPGCENLHLMADRLGIFDGDGDWDIQKAMAKMGENVNVVNNDNVLEMSVEDLVGQEGMEKLTNTGGKDDDGKDDGTKS